MCGAGRRTLQDRSLHFGTGQEIVPPVPKANNKIKNILSAPDPAQHRRFPKENDSPDPSPGIPGGWGAQTKIRNRVKHKKVMGDD